MQVKIFVYFQIAVSPDQSGDIVIKVRTLVYKTFLKLPLIYFILL